MLKQLLVISIILFNFYGYSQKEAPEMLTQDFLAPYEPYDYKSAALGDATYLVENVTFYNDNRKIIDSDKVSEYRLNSDFTIDEMYIDKQKFVKVVLYRKSSPAEKLEKEKTLKKLKEKDSDDFRGTYPKPFRIKDLNGKVYTPETLKGKVVIINYWFIGCVPCEKEMPVLNDLVKKYEGKDVVFLALTFDKKERVKQFLSKTDFDFNIVPEAQQMISDYNIMGYPSHMIMDKKLVIQYLGMIPEPVLLKEIIKAIDMLLAK
ncbi:MAG: TlpA disulfide reductase family protein [Nonlabens sp.]